MGLRPAILWGQVDGTFAAAEPLDASRATPYALAVADLDQNGRMGRTGDSFKII